MRRKAIALVLAAILCTYSQSSISAELDQVISGSKFPLNLKLMDLDSEWRGFSISGQFETGGGMQVFNSLLVTTANNLYYTKGQTITVGSETYLIAYRLDITERQLKLTPETKLMLSLLNLRTIGSLNNIRQFNFEQERAMFDRFNRNVLPLNPSLPAIRNSPLPPRIPSLPVLPKPSAIPSPTLRIPPLPPKSPSQILPKT
jgi:hypothetical protein